MAVKRATTIPKAPLARIMMQAGAQRISSDALDVLVEIIEDKAQDIASQAVKISKHAGRKTVNDGDIRLAVRK
ncbi:NFYB/HAP3 family transcription factor subunit [Candidatus Woesearchaeota archaeon]|nr:NFYB/HAP3 family transcription factor subunit [Candidatus Woesearchaeota archaeon]MBW3005765.1 NFYB/HAP3 family transcription factor subunit [Candidatus Woesearchaeota archaeon]